MTLTSCGNFFAEGDCFNIEEHVGVKWNLVKFMKSRNYSPVFQEMNSGTKDTLAVIGQYYTNTTDSDKNDNCRVYQKFGRIMDNKHIFQGTHFEEFVKASIDLQDTLYHMVSSNDKHKECSDYWEENGNNYTPRVTRRSYDTLQLNQVKYPKPYTFSFSMWDVGNWVPVVLTFSETHQMIRIQVHQKTWHLIGTAPIEDWVTLE